MATYINDFLVKTGLHDLTNRDIQTAFDISRQRVSQLTHTTHPAPLPGKMLDIARRMAAIKRLLYRMHCVFMEKSGGEQVFNSITPYVVPFFSSSFFVPPLPVRPGEVPIQLPSLWNIAATAVINASDDRAIGVQHNRKIDDPRMIVPNDYLWANLDGIVEQFRGTQNHERRNAERCVREHLSRQTDTNTNTSESGVLGYAEIEQAFRSTAPVFETD